MADKITEDTIKKLIEQALKEEQLNEKRLPITINDPRREMATIGMLGKGLDGADLKKLVGEEDPDNVLDVDDFETAFSRSANNKARKAAEFIFKNTYNDDIRDEIAKIKISDAADSATMTTAMSQSAKSVSNVADFASLSRSSVNNVKTKISQVLKSNVDLGAGLAVPELDFNQLITKAGTQDGLWRLISQKLGATNNVEDALKKICKFITDVQQGTFDYDSGSTTDKDKITELIVKMSITQSLMNILGKSEYSPAGFLMENFLALLIGGIVAGSNQEGEDLIFKDAKGVTLYSSKLKDKLSDVDIGQRTSKAVIDVLGKKGKYGVKAGKNIKYIYGVKDKANNASSLQFYTATYTEKHLKKAAGGTNLPKSKLKAIPGAFIDLSNTGTEEMLKNFAVLANSLAVDLNAIYKSMNNFKILMNTYFIEWQPDIALGAAEEFKILKTNVNAGFKKGGTKHRLKEQKITASFLKKLISESFKK